MRRRRFSRGSWRARRRAKRRGDIWPIAAWMREAIARFGLGYAPSGGEALLRHLKTKYSEKLVELAGLASRDPSGRVHDRFRRRIIFPIANEVGQSGRVRRAGAGRRSAQVFEFTRDAHLHQEHACCITSIAPRSRFARRTRRFSSRATWIRSRWRGRGINNVVASCGTSLTETQVKLISRFTRRIIVNYDPDTAGQAATERSLAILLEHNCDVRVLALPGGKDPDTFIRTEGAGAYRKLLESRARVSRLSDRPGAAIGRGERRAEIAGDEFSAAVRAANSQCAVAVGMGFAHRAAIARRRTGAARSAQRKAAAERRNEVKTQPGLPARRPSRRSGVWCKC